VVNYTAMLLGPLVGPECRRAVARGWLIVVRALAACVIFGVAGTGIWWWWINNGFDEFFRPFWTLRATLTIIEWLALILCLVMGPALLAGSLAGERERGALGLLLTTRVNSLEIVLGRLVGKLTQVGMVLLASIPAVALLAAMAGFGLFPQLMLVALPAAVAFGGSGLAVAASSVAKRGRDALLAVYIGVILALLSPLISFTSLPAGFLDWVGALNPFFGLTPLVWEERTAVAATTVGLWLAMGLAGTAVAAWRLRPACLGPKDADRLGRRAMRRWWVPPLDERPMLWKELYIERAGTLGKVGRWLGWLFVVVMGGGSLALAAVVAWNLWVRPDQAWEQWATDHLKLWVGYTAPFVSCLLQWALGLRAAVGISAERERGTWDAILSSPLEGREIVTAKLWGCLEALSPLIGATLLAWTLALVCGATDPRDYVSWIVSLFVVGAFMAAVGVRTSLEASTATRSMSLTIGIWLGSWAAVAILAGVIIGVVCLLCLYGWMAAMQMGLLPPATAPWFPMPMWVGWPLTTNLLFLLATILIISDTRLRFDRIAGRMTEGKVSIALERMIYGTPNDPAFLDGQAAPNVETPVGENGHTEERDQRLEDAVSESA
jgi:ABC-type transport system involved in multi-copper enzyme maturation permease subunit